MWWLASLALLLVAGWVGAGLLVLFLGSRKAGTVYERRTQKRIYSVGENIEVNLRLTPERQDGAVEPQDIVLLLDHSTSMGSGPGSPLREAVRAANNFILRLPDSSRVAVVGFNHGAKLLTRLSQPQQHALQAVNSLAAGGDTAIHEALAHCREVLGEGRPGVRKTIILLTDGESDFDAAAREARLLREGPFQPTIISVGVGPGVNAQLLEAVAGSRERYIQIGSPESLHHLFKTLAQTITGQAAGDGLVREEMFAPHPFRLGHMGGLHPIEVATGEPSHITWAVPLMDKNPFTLTYGVTALCPGWREIAAPKSMASWRFSDGAEKRVAGPRGPRVLILPPWLAWAWPVLNPLFWMLFGRLWPCARAPQSQAAPADEIPLPEVSFPRALPPATDVIYEPSVKPALVIGLGEAGELVTCHVKGRLRDRNVPAGVVKVMAVRTSHKINSGPTRLGSVSLQDDERLELHQDLRPYLETLRSRPVPPLRQWIPWRDWLAEVPPLVTTRPVGDRRKARLALLLKAQPVEERIEQEVARVRQADGLVFVVGSPADPDGSGLLGEVAHMCAERGVSVVAVLLPSAAEDKGGASALARELERMIVLRGQALASDRRDPPAKAQKLFDKVLVIDSSGPSAESAASEAADLVWSILAYDRLYKQLPAPSANGGEVTCATVKFNGSALPAYSLWRWVRENTLAAGINGQRLGLAIKDGRPALPTLDRETIEQEVKAFWSGDNRLRPQGMLLSAVRAVVNQKEPGPGGVTALLALQDNLPSTSPYHEQVAYAQRERQTFAAYLEEWGMSVLQKEADPEAWRIQLLFLSLGRVEEDLNELLGRFYRLSGNADFADAVSFVSSLGADFLAVLSGLKKDLLEWLSLLVGEQAEFGAAPPRHTEPPVSLEIERARGGSERDLLSLFDQSREDFLPLFDDWYRSRGNTLLGQFRPTVRLERAQQRVRFFISHRGAPAAPQASALLASLREALDQQRHHVLRWAQERPAEARAAEHPLESLRLGKKSGDAYPDVPRAIDEEDPYIVAALRIREQPLRNALCPDDGFNQEPPYVWPEESNAHRIAERYRNRLQRNPPPYSPLVVSLMQDPQKMLAFFNDVAQGRLRLTEFGAVLERGGRTFLVAKKPADANYFSQAIKAVVLHETSSDGEDIPPPATQSIASADELLKAIEGNPVVATMARTPEWGMWREVVRGAVLAQPLTQG
ncbi:MAG: VWA domain-containing protein [Acidobacteriota bacterium]|nr:VWA domain-containing protein [Acidobacteriota bacterium]